MKIGLSLLLSLAPFFLFAQTDSLQALEEITVFRQKLNEEYQNPKESPLSPEALQSFTGHEFYPVALKYRVQARFKRTENEPVFKMTTSTDRRPEYVKYGEAQFELDGKTYTLNLYQSLALTQKTEYKDYLFLPFTDLTNGKQSYGGGRYLDLRIPKGNTILIDFNQAYNPFCAYSHKYSCPVPPKENHLSTEIKAGIKMKGH
jgi:uncharacterized protein (DUF1684 family)